MNKYSVIAIILAIVSGVVIGSGFTSQRAGRELENLKEHHKRTLERSNDSLLNAIHSRDKRILELEQSTKLDSIKVQGLLSKIKQDELKTDQKRLDAKKLTPSEKVAYIISRYNH